MFALGEKLWKSLNPRSNIERRNHLQFTVYLLELQKPDCEIFAKLHLKLYFQFTVYLQGATMGAEW